MHKNGSLKKKHDQVWIAPCTTEGGTQSEQLRKDSYIGVMYGIIFWS